MTRGLTRGRDDVCRVAPLPQTRSFTWSGSDMASSTNPETGTIGFVQDYADQRYYTSNYRSLWSVLPTLWSVLPASVTEFQEIS